MVIQGTWGWHAKFGSRFDVDAWAPIPRAAADKPVAPAEPVPRKTRRLAMVPEALITPVVAAKPVKASKAARRSPRRTAPNAKAIEQTTDWYSESGGKGDSLDFMDA